MTGTPQAVTAANVYRYRLWQRCLGGVFGVFFVVGGLGLLLKPALPEPMHGLGVVALAAMPLALGAYLLAVTFRPRITLTGSQIEVRSAFGKRSAERSEIEGFRSLSSRYGSYKQLILTNGRPRIPIRLSFKTDDNYRAWFQDIPDLDLRDRDTLLAEIQNQQDLGATPEERLGALPRAKHRNIALLAIAVAAAVGFKFAAQPWMQACAAVLLVAPLAGAWLCRRQPLLYTVFKKKQDPRADTCYALLAAGFGMLVHIDDFHFLSFKPLLLGMATAGMLIVLLNYRPARSGFGGRSVMAIVFLAALYAYGSVTITDACFDRSPAAVYVASVIGEHVIHGRTTSYYLHLAPWGPVKTDLDVAVPYSLYHSAALGHLVCLELHTGSLSAPWFRVASCSQSGVSSSGSAAPLR